ncbi:2704_t:CDS:2, partial [Paraglomus brasilianum]
CGWIRALAQFHNVNYVHELLYSNVEDTREMVALPSDLMYDLECQINLG